MPVKKDKKLKPKKMRAVRGGRARGGEKKPNVNQVVNVYTDRTEPYRMDFKNQFRYGLGYADAQPYNPFITQTTQSIQPQSLTESLKVIPPKELEAKQVVEQFPVPFGAPKGKSKKVIPPKELEAKQVVEQFPVPFDAPKGKSKNPYESESEGSPRPIRSDAGKARGSYKVKHIAEGRNIQNLFALRAGSETETEEAVPQFITSRSNI